MRPRRRPRKPWSQRNPKGTAALRGRSGSACCTGRQRIPPAICARVCSTCCIAIECLLPDIPTAAERDAIFQAFARALFKDMDALYEVVTPDFVWRYHDGVSTERVLTGRDAVSGVPADLGVFFMLRDAFTTSSTTAA